MGGSQLLHILSDEFGHAPAILEVGYGFGRRCIGFAKEAASSSWYSNGHIGHGLVLRVIYLFRRSRSFRFLCVLMTRIE